MESYWVATIVAISIIGFLVVVILGASFCTVISEQREDKKLCNTLRSRLEAGDAQRQERRIALLKSEMGADAEQVEKFADIVHDLESSLYEKLITIFSENKEQFAHLDRTIEEMINSFSVSTAGVMQGRGSAQGGQSGQEHEIILNKLTQENDELREANEKLTLELETMRKESERIMAEYISMYAEKENKQA